MRDRNHLKLRSFEILAPRSRIIRSLRGPEPGDICLPNQSMWLDYSEFLFGAGFPCRFRNFRIANVKGTAHAGFKIDLEKLAAHPVR